MIILISSESPETGWKWKTEVEHNFCMSWAFRSSRDLLYNLRRCFVWAQVCEGRTLVGSGSDWRIDGGPAGWTQLEYHRAPRGESTSVAVAMESCSSTSCLPSRCLQCCRHQRLTWLRYWTNTCGSIYIRRTSLEESIIPSSCDYMLPLLFILKL